MKNYLQRTSGSTKTNDDSENPTSNPVIKENTESLESDDDQQLDDISKSTGTGTIPPQNESIIKFGTNLTPTESALQTLSTDPPLWPKRLGDAEKFPSDDTGRKFSANTRVLRNGEQVVRDWLVYLSLIHI